MKISSLQIQAMSNVMQLNRILFQLLLQKKKYKYNCTSFSTNYQTNNKCFCNIVIRHLHIILNKIFWSKKFKITNK